MNNPPGHRRFHIRLHRGVRLLDRYQYLLISGRVIASRESLGYYGRIRHYCQLFMLFRRGAGGERQAWPGRGSAAGSAGSGAVSGMMTGNHFLRVPGGAAVTAKFTVTVRRVLEDGTEVPLEGELAAALDAPAEQFAGLAAWT